MTDPATRKPRKPRKPATAHAGTAPGDKPGNDLAAAQAAIEIAAAVAPGEPPMIVPTAHSPGTGLVDYGMWVEMFSHTPPVTPAGPYSRGRIWA